MPDLILMFIMTTQNMHVERDARWRTLLGDTELRTGRFIEQSISVTQHEGTTPRRFRGEMAAMLWQYSSLCSVSSTFAFEPQSMPSAWCLR